jgi:hypothetical protein
MRDSRMLCRAGDGCGFCCRRAGCIAAGRYRWNRGIGSAARGRERNSILRMAVTGAELFSVLDERLGDLSRTEAGICIGGQRNQVSDMAVLRSCGWRTVYILVKGARAYARKERSRAPYRVLNACIGSTEAARRAGTRDAAAPTASSTQNAPMASSGS